MKQFFSSLFGSLVALCVFFGGGLLLLIGVIGAIVAMSHNKTVTVEPGSYLVFDLSARITDAPPAYDFHLTGEKRNEALQLRTVTRALRAAAKDSRIAGVFLKGDVSEFGGGAGYAALKEIHQALADFKASGKPVKAYLSFASTKDYYLASVADEVVLDPYGMIVMPGLASEPMFYAGALERFGIGVQVTRVGKYKSYVEPFVRKDMSPESREQLQKLLGDIWGDLVGDIAKARGLTPAKVQQTVDAEGIVRAEAAKTAKLVDRVAYRDEVIQEMKKATGRNRAKETFKQIGLSEYTRVAKDGNGDIATDGVQPAVQGERLAIVYAEGSIVDGESDEAGEIASLTLSRELRRLRQDDDVKAVVLRVNSPGGSATAAEAIQRELRLMRKVKPVIISMGTYAASGGYWISAYGDRIFAEPTTITGSIGVFGMQFDVKKLANDFGFTFDSVKTGKFADTFTIARPKTEEEMAMFQRMVDWIYGEFVAKVAEGRHLKPDFVQEIAQGRVWSGVEAKKLGLVDEIGGLDKAIAYAAGKAGLGGHYRVSEYPRKKDFAEAMQEALGKIVPSNARATGVTAQISQRIEAELKTLRCFNDPAGIYTRLPLEIVIR
ncbi:MAG: signal peptide peptidase SppA [Verrucomicrobia bacterium]|nr:signal peptide peptidase SppA [Verrucomicrobiota bacterium]